MISRSVLLRFLASTPLAFFLPKAKALSETPSDLDTNQRINTSIPGRLTIVLDQQTHNVATAKVFLEGVQVGLIQDISINAMVFSGTAKGDIVRGEMNIIECDQNLGIISKLRNLTWLRVFSRRFSHRLV